MEGYGLAYACESARQPRPDWLLIKSICDFADAGKDNKFQLQAATVSMRYCQELLQLLAAEPHSYFEG